MMRKKAEWIERQAWRDLAGTAVAGRVGLSAEPLGEALLLHQAAVNNALFNRAIGLGGGAEASQSQLDAVLARLQSDGVTRCFVQVYADELPPSVPHWLAARGWGRYRRAWNKLARGRSEPLPNATTDLAIRPALPADADALVKIFAEGFDLPPAGAQIFAAAIQRQSWQTWVATDAEAVVGAGLAFMAEGVAYLAGGATLRAYRGRGAQLALLRVRCQEALDSGCELIVSETGAPLPGDPQHSHRNLERCGLRVIGTRLNYAPEGMQWDHGVQT